MAPLNGSLDGCCWAILSVVQFLFSFVNNRIAIFPLPEKAILVTQSFMCLHEIQNRSCANSTHKKVDGLQCKYLVYLVYLNDFNTVLTLCLITCVFDWVQKSNEIKHSSMHIFGV